VADPSLTPVGGAERFRAALAEAGMTNPIVELPESTHTADAAARAVGCAVAQIAKSLVFRAKTSGRPVLVVASGANRVDEKAVGELIGEPIGKANADFVRERTGFAIGGVAPIGHVVAPITLVDEDLLTFDGIWAAAGTPNAVFRLTPDELLRVTGARAVAVAARPH
jgi:prolyl-tRNA editing enzyme YbaK/EbsC (Cys-tRNA(Pro) deacylase)